MTVSAASSGTQTTSGTTEHTLATITTAGVYELNLDVSALVGGTTPDILRVRENRKTLSGGTARTEWEEFLVGGMCPPMVTFRPKLTVVEVAYTITMTQGSNRAIPWSINQVA
jgi:hypothetical protein